MATTQKERFERTLGEREAAEHVQALLWGPPKSGKTVLAHTWPRTITLDFDDGMESVITACRRGWIDKDPSELRYLTIAETDTAEFGYVKRPNAMEQAVDYVNYWADDSRWDTWDTLIVDSITSMGDYCINQALYNLGKLKGYSDSKQKSDRVKMRIMQRQDWNPAMSLLSNFINELREFDKHLLVLAHEHHETTESGAVVSKSPYVIGRVLRQDIPKSFDEVWYMSQDEDGNTEIQTRESRKIVAGSRLGLPNPLKNPSYSSIMEEVGR